MRSSAPIITRAVLVSCAFAFASPAHAWESECRVGDIRDREIRHSICRASEFQTCAEGVAAPRGTQWGEHALIAELALIRAGLSDVALRRDALPPYYTDRAQVAGDPTLATQVPAPPGAALVRLERPLAIAEMAQVPDVSYSLADFLAGNEHCFVDNAARGTFEEVQACHTYFTHLGPVNSTHFLPQAQAVYRHYHAIALGRASACRRLAEALPRARAAGLAPEIVAHLERGIGSCRMQALAFESVGAHYLADAWSTGHMWQRWGSPVYPRTRVGQLGAMVVGALSGLQHGWRAVAANTLGLSGGPIHDRLCLPGPFAGDDERRWVRFKPHGGDALILGAGDDYLLACTSMEPAWSLLDGEHVAEQRERMLDCVAKGFFDVHRQASPTPITPPPGLPPGLDPAGAACWGQRVSNRTLYEGTGVTAWRRSNDPAVLARMIVRAHAGRVLGEVAARAAGALLFEVRMDLVALQAEIMWRAWRDPDGTEAADLPGPNLGQLLFTKRNSAYADLIDQGQVSYYEQRDPSLWSARPHPVPATCESDADCLATAFCGPPAGMDKKRRCYPQEAVFLNAYRAAHLEAWCFQDDYPAITAAAMRCRESEGRASHACDACVEAVLPRLAPSESDDDEAAQTLCEIVAGGTSAIVRRDFDPSKAGDAERAARDFCAGGSEEEADPAGTWDSPQGCLQVSRSEELVLGTVFYPSGGRASLDGTLGERTWKFRWSANLAERGEGELTVSSDGDTLSGHYVDAKGVRAPWQLRRRTEPCAAARPGGFAVLLETSATGLWHWKNYRCTLTEREVVSGAAEYREKAIAERWQRFVERNERCRDKGCERQTGPYARFWFPQSWSMKQVPLQSVPSMWRPKGSSRCEGTMDGGFAGAK